MDSEFIDKLSFFVTFTEECLGKIPMKRIMQ